MSDDSPLFVSTIELIAHSIDLYTSKDERKYKYIILHLANAIELILKDRLVDIGVCIYKDKNTINIWDSFKKLKERNINLPERPIIEILVDDRNTIQHRFGFPDSKTVFFYLQRVISFFKRFLNEEYSVDLADSLKDYLSKEKLSLMGLVEEDDQYSQLDKLSELSPESALLQAYNIIESKFLKAMGIDLETQIRPISFWRHADFPHLLDDMAIDGFISQDTVRNFKLLRQMRNRAAHTAHFDEMPSSDWDNALKVAKDLLRGLDRALENGYFQKRKEKLEATKNESVNSETPNKSEEIGELRS